MKINNLSDTEVAKGFKLLQIGESGDGKTHRALTATMFGPLFVIDLDNKLKGYVKKLPLPQRQLIDYVVCQTAQEVNDTINSLDDKYATICFDTWTVWHDMLIADHTERNRSKRVVVKAFDGSLVEQFAMPDWGTVKAINKRFLRKLLSLPFNIIVNTHVGRSQDAQDRQVLTVGTTGSHGAEMPRSFEESHYLYADNIGKRKVRGRKGMGGIVANTQLPEDLLDPAGNFKPTSDLSDNDLSIFKGLAKEKK